MGFVAQPAQIHNNIVYYAVYAVICHLSFDFLGFIEYFCFHFTLKRDWECVWNYFGKKHLTAMTLIWFRFFQSLFFWRDDAHCLHFLAKQRKSIYLIELIWFFFFSTIFFSFGLSFSIEFRNDSLFFFFFFFAFTTTKSHLM